MRKYIQSNLKEIKTIKCGPFVPDSIIENGTTYFGYQLQSDYVQSDFDNNYEMRASLLGFVTRKENTNEDTLQIVDDAKEEIIQVLKKMNFKTSYKDVSLENGIRKIQITANAKYNDKFKKLI